MSNMAIYSRILKKISTFSIVNEEDILKQFSGRHGINVTVEKSDLCHGGFTVSVEGMKFFLSERPISYLNKHWGRSLLIQERSNPFGIALPLYIGEGNLSSEIHKISNSNNPIKNANEWLFNNFSIEIAIAYFNQYFQPSESFSPYKTIIFEAIEAFYSGYDHIAIMSLFPVFEGGLRNLLVKFTGSDDTNTNAEIFEKGLRNLLINWGTQQLGDYDWHPGKGYDVETEINFFTHINPQCDVLNCTRSFFKNVIYKPTHGVNSGSFNRHLTLHLLNNNFNEPSNFVRIFLALTHITFAESLFNPKVPFSWKGVSKNDEFIANYIRGFTDSIFTHRRDIIKHLGLFLY
ncbi:hypothetical protein [Ewingella allii]|uniref:hypothetical protein n=1 Tax=Ewingella allii TaxID=3092550 RepID=UPI003791947D